MRIAKLKSTEAKTTGHGILDNYYKVPNNHVFSSSEEDVTTFDNLYVFANGGKFDYGVFRDSLQEIVILDWGALSFEERRKCIKHYKYPASISQEEFNSYFSESEHERNWNILTVKTRAVRLQRLFAAFQKISYRLNAAQVATIYMVTKNMCYDYYYASLPHVIYWVQNGAYPPLGINFTSNGFAQQGGFSTSVMNELLDIFVNGNYENFDNEIIII